MKFPDQLEQLMDRVETKLKLYLPATHTNPVKLHQAMQYAVLNGGKRIRPLLVYATGLSLHGDINKLDKPAAAVELIHAYSLIHDDLPAMDNADLRRNKATCHKAFDEATAILAGDALLPLAFEIIASLDNNECDLREKLTMLLTLAHACGSKGMVGGQILDLEAESKPISLDDLNILHHKKTGKLIAAAIKFGAIMAKCRDKHILATLEMYAKNIGLAFQIQDDILDIETETKILGKTQGKDAALNKITYPILLGLSDAKEKMHYLYSEAQSILDKILPQTSLLHLLTKQLWQRHY